MSRAASKKKKERVNLTLAGAELCISVHYVSFPESSEADNLEGQIQELKRRSSYHQLP